MVASVSVWWCAVADPGNNHSRRGCLVSERAAVRDAGAELDGWIKAELGDASIIVCRDLAESNHSRSGIGRQRLRSWSIGFPAHVNSPGGLV
jgi:hypothetical protein